MRHLLLLVLFALACAGGSAPARRTSATPAAVPQRADFFGGLDSSLKAARQAGAQLFAPTRYAEAITAYRRADEAYGTGARPDRLRGLVSEARGAADLAAKRAREVRTALEPASTAREAGLGLNALTLASDRFQEGERRYAEAIQQGEKGATGPLRQLGQRAADAYRQAARKALEDGPLARFRARLEANRRTMNRDTFNLLNRRLERARSMAARVDDRGADVAQISTGIAAALDSLAGMGRAAPMRPPLAALREPVLSVSHDDPNATDYRPNVATRRATKDNPYWMNLDPTLTLRLTFADGDRMWNAAAPFDIRWTITTSAPIDHLDLRIIRQRGASDQVAHFIERPRKPDGHFPMGTRWDPNTDRNRGADQWVSYTVEAVVVDQLGRASTVACAEANVQFGEERFAVVTWPVCLLEFDDRLGDPAWDPPPDTVEITYQVTRDGDTVTTFRPSELVLHGTVGTITVLNRDVRPHHLRSAYTPPYFQNPLIPSLAVGGVAPLDFGTLNPGESRTLDIPVGALHNYRWTLHDLLGPSRYPAVVIRIYAPTRS